MQWMIKEFASLTGVSVRTLHYYDKINLLKPALIHPENGYRFYDDTSLSQMQVILFYRELDFPLKTIHELLTSPYFNQREALSQQKQLLILKQKHLSHLIAAIDKALKGDTMDLKVFDNHDYEAKRSQYEAEARKRWGHTDAYAESVRRTADRTPEEQKTADTEMDTLLHTFGQYALEGRKPEDSDVQKLVKTWQDYITRTYYPCTDAILAGLGNMYTADERFKSTINSHGSGTAELMGAAIAVYCLDSSH